jgi:hypothetical protein
MLAGKPFFAPNPMDPRREMQRKASLAMLIRRRLGQ